MNKDKTILFVMPRLPFPASSGRKTSLFHYCRILSEELRYRLIVAAFLESGDNPTQKPDFIDELVILPKASAKSRVMQIIKDSIILRRKPMQVALYWSPEAKKIVNQLIKKEHPQYVIGDMVRSTEYIRDVGSFRIADLDDRISLRYKRQMETDIDGINPYGAFLYTMPKLIQSVMMTKPLKLMVMKNEIVLLERYEKEIGKVCEKTIFVAEKEAQEFNKELLQEKAVAIPIGVDVDYFHYRQFNAKENKIGFLGAMSVAHNENAARHFIDKILPYVLKRVPDAVFTIIGGGVSEQLQKLESEHVHFIGRVNDVRDYLEQCKVFVCPMTFGSGIKTKNLEAMAMGVPVVTSTIGAENINAVNGHEWIIAEKDDNFVNAIVELLLDDKKREYIGKNGSTYISRNFTWGLAKKRFEELFMDIQRG